MKYSSKKATRRLSCGKFTITWTEVGPTAQEDPENWVDPVYQYYLDDREISWANLPDGVTMEIINEMLENPEDDDYDDYDYDYDDYPDYDEYDDYDQ